ncbi:16S rRNA (cytosine(1402)-N(4))-methyltransferase RsmH [Chloroflexi bacterium TSY]|nr:16S rRNA (cytosine(1402)-N(4))-methyltransferase RsmH [Chloroflexi bacterium TSY]
MTSDTTTIPSDPDGVAHIPVLLEETVSEMRIQSDGIYIDGTIGGGGHTSAILEKSAPNGHVLGLDSDPAALRRVRRRFTSAFSSGRLLLAHANFSDLIQIAQANCSSTLDFMASDAILLDLGVSSFQLETPERGFAFAQNGPLDMRMDPSQDLNADLIVNQWSERDIADLIYRYGEEPRSRRIAKYIVQSRPLHSTDELASVVLTAIGSQGVGNRGRSRRTKWNKEKPRIHPATRVFQALRITVNQELERLSSALLQAASILKRGGRLAVISFHSLEDRIVKQWMQAEARSYVADPSHPMGGYDRVPLLRIITRKPIRPTQAEREKNPRSRSARLRVAERI